VGFSFHFHAPWGLRDRRYVTASVKLWQNFAVDVCGIKLAWSSSVRFKQERSSVGISAFASMQFFRLLARDTSLAGYRVRGETVENPRG
jgi:hypothetical protein